MYTVSFLWQQCCLPIVIDLSRLTKIVDRGPRSSTMPVEENISYLRTPSRPTANVSSGQVDRANEQNVAASNPNYSSFGPAYESINSSRQQQGNRQVPISQRYEFAEIHTETDNRVQDYEVSRDSIVQAQEYSHLQH